MHGEGENIPNGYNVLRVEWLEDRRVKPEVVGSSAANREAHIFLELAVI
jgi:hypothetical protein